MNMKKMKKIGNALLFPFRAVWYGLVGIFLVIGMWIVDVVTHRSPHDNTG